MQADLVGTYLAYGISSSIQSGRICIPNLRTWEKEQEQEMNAVVTSIVQGYRMITWISSHAYGSLLSLSLHSTVIR